jgi:hypothetical protein
MKEIEQNNRGQLSNKLNKDEIGKKSIKKCQKNSS